VRSWQGTARFESSAVVSAPADRAWALLGSPEAWSLSAGHACVFEIPVQRIRLYIGIRADGRVFGMPMEITGGDGDRHLEVQAGEQRAWRLSAEVTRRGTKLRIAGSIRVRREQVVETEATLRESLVRWLGQIRAVLDGSRPWPSVGVPEELRAAALDVPQPQGALEAAVTVDLDVPVPLAGRLLRAPEVVAAGRAAAWELAQGAGVLWSGSPPGERPGEVGALSCVVRRAGGLAGLVSVCTASSPTGYVLRQVQWPYDQISREVTAAGAGSRLELKQRFLPRQAEVPPEDYQTRAREALADLAGSVKTAIEAAARREAGL